MRVGAINNQVAFGQVTKIKSITNLTRPVENKQIDKHTKAIEDVLNNAPQSVYSIAETKKIKNFFKKNIEDYTDETPVVMKKIEGDIYLLTGSNVYSAFIAERLSENAKKDIQQNTAIPEVLKPVYKKEKEREFGYLIMSDYYIGRKSIILNSSEIDVAKLSTEQYIGEKPIDGKLDTLYCFEKTEQKDKLKL